VAIYTRRSPRDIRTIAMDSSSRTSVALATVLLHREFGVAPDPVSMAPDLDAMLARADAALIIGDAALFLDALTIDNSSIANTSTISPQHSAIAKHDLGELWTRSTGLPFVYAVWTGWQGTATQDDVAALQKARDEGVAHADEVARAYYPGDPERQAVAARYLRDNIRYRVGDDELEGLRTFYRYAAELKLVSFDGQLRFF
jgi:predicted solute-binding protein